MAKRRPTPERLKSLSNAVFTAISTILVLELCRPALLSFDTLPLRWPTGIAFVLSALIIAVVWVNHGHLLQRVAVCADRLIWVNFTHLFFVSLIPFAATWMANTRLSEIPVSVYGTDFFLVSTSYIVLCWEVVRNSRQKGMASRMRQTMRIRSSVTLLTSAAAALVALQYPMMGVALICLCLTSYSSPKASAYE